VSADEQPRADEQARADEQHRTDATAPDEQRTTGDTSVPERPPAPEPVVTGDPLVPVIKPEHHTLRQYEVRHRTTYTYEEYVTDSFGRALLRPRQTDQQRVVEHTVEITPEPHILTEHVDHFGNQSSFYEVRTPHTVLDVHKRSLMEIEWPPPDMDRLNAWTVAEVAELVATGDELDRAEAAQYLLPSQLVEIAPEVIAYSAGILPPDRPFGEGLVALYSDIYRDFTYAKGTTSVKTTLPELLAQREGVCQDFAHLTLGALRSVGIPARYVSGYLTVEDGEVARGATVQARNHAWIELWDGGWHPLDPTNVGPVGLNHVVVGRGRDYDDVSPFRGMFVGPEITDLELEITYTRLG
jgi:transglutaminase-like putative cysteine protease